MGSVIGRAFLTAGDFSPEPARVEQEPLRAATRIERRSGNPHPVYDETADTAGPLRQGLVMATITALVFWGVVALMILFVLA